MFRRIDIFAGLGALVLHAGVALAMLSVRPPPPRHASEVEFEVKKNIPPPPPKITEPEPPPKEPEPKVVKVEKTPPPPTPVPNREPPKEPPKEVKPVFGVNMDSTTDDPNAVAVPVGNTTMIKPEDSGKDLHAEPLPKGKPGGDPTPQVYKPVADIYVKTLPEIDGEACARTVTYPPEAEQAGIEGEIKLRVSLDEHGKVHDIKVLSGLGHGLDQAAMNALRYRCKFKPAVDTTGKAVAYVIQTYTWTFELPR